MGSPTWDRRLAEENARKWLEEADQNEKVGSTHHTVPKFYLRRFANSSAQLRVRDRATGKESIRNIKDMGIKDFYTAATEDGGLDARLEQALAMMEDATANLFSKILSPYRPPVPLELEERYTLATFIAFQLVRGVRKRREIELMADWSVKFTNGDKFKPRELEELTVVPHPNEHLRTFGHTPEAMAHVMADRPVTLVTLDEPLLIVCDEPVIVNVPEGHVRHLPTCNLAGGRSQKKKKGRRKMGAQIVHVYPTRPSGVEIAAEIALPVTPRGVLILGPRGGSGDPQAQLIGAEAKVFAERVNRCLIDNSYAWVAAHPDNEDFRAIEIAPPGPIVAVCDGGSVMSRNLQAAPNPHQPALLRKGWRT